MLEKVPSSFAPSTTTTWRASFWSSDSGRGKHQRQASSYDTDDLVHGW
jgi:hypothetical protein